MKITKVDIGLPSDLKNLSHVGWDPNQGFALDNVDPNLLKFFARAGISESHLKDKATREFIYDFIDKHGGKEAASREISSLQDNAGLFSAPPDCRVGLNFANDAEAEVFLMAVKENIRITSEKRERRRLSQQQSQPLVKPTPVATNGSASKTTVRTTTITNSVMTIKSADIVLPSDFKHLSHIGWDPNQGFALDNVDPNLLKFFARAGISESHLKDKATREFIYNFIDKHGAKEAAIREISSLQHNAGLFSAPPDCRVGLNFANDAEAEVFLMAVKENMRIKSEKRERRRLSQQQSQPLVKPTPVATNGSASKTTVRTTTITNSVMTIKSADSVLP
ncbi:Wiskott-Aldrich Syndrome-like protein [Daphnia magna]|uniref:Wiskott-Aldrich Syndrome-like protein n=1 Tax=Daphnia magna TaxID=35525 RepID=A0A164GD43_9CRUS|nr:Wiskott-Aldrich Syndrome-like protein [Daphnia magna]